MAEETDLLDLTTEIVSAQRSRLAKKIGLGTTPRNRGRKKR